MASRTATPPGFGLIFARHGRTAWNTAGRYQGQSDPPLSADGEREAAALARSLAGLSISRVFTSPLRRAAGTAAIVSDRLGIAQPVADPRLLEIAYGEWEGLTQAEIKSRWPEEMRLWKRSPQTVRFPGGEALTDLHRRLRAFLSDERLLSASQATDSGRTLVVAHGGLIRIAVIEAGQLPYAAFRKIDVAPGSTRRFFLHRSIGGSVLSLASPPDPTAWQAV